MQYSALRHIALRSTFPVSHRASWLLQETMIPIPSSVSYLSSLLVEVQYVALHRASCKLCLPLDQAGLVRVV